MEREVIDRMKNYVLKGFGILSSFVSLLSFQVITVLAKCFGIVIIEEEKVFYEGTRD